MRSGSTSSARTGSAQQRVSGGRSTAYVAKGSDWTPAEEMTRSDLKTSRTGSRTPFQILADYYQTGDTRDRDLWREYARVTRSLAAVRWSRGLRTAVNGPAIGAERTDEELAAEDVGGNQLAILEFPAWARIRAAGLEHAVLVAAEHGGLRAVDSLIDPASIRPGFVAGHSAACSTRGAAQECCWRL
jgi:hypothetical protein